MRKIVPFLLFFLVFQIFFVKPAIGATNICTTFTISDGNKTNNIIDKTAEFDSNVTKLDMTIGGKQIAPGTRLMFYIDSLPTSSGGADSSGLFHYSLVKSESDSAAYKFKPQNHSITLKTAISSEELCSFPTAYKISAVPVSTTCQISSWKDVYTPGDELGIVVKKSSIPNYRDNEIYAQISDPSGKVIDDASGCDFGTNNDGDFVHKRIIQVGKQGYWRAKVYKSDNSVGVCRKGGDFPLCQDVTFQVTSEPPLSTSPPPQGSFTWGTGQKTADKDPICTENKINGKTNFTCSTAIGNIDTEPTAFIKRIFGVLLGISGGIALILIIVSGYHLMMAQGNPEKIQGAKETLTAAIVGLLFIIFSFVILEVIGVDLLKIPGLGK